MILLQKYITNCCFGPVGKIFELISSGKMIVPDNGFRILDIGFGNLAGYFALDFNGYVSKFIGVNEMSEANFEVKWPANNDLGDDMGSGELEHSNGTLHFQYAQFFNKVGGGYFIDNEPEFKAKYNIVTNKKAERFIEEKTPIEKFDLIVLSNLLHFIEFENVKKILEYSMKALSADGYIFIQVWTNETSKFYSERQITIEQLSQMELIINTFDKKKLSKGHFQLVGKQK